MWGTDSGREGGGREGEVRETAPGQMLLEKLFHTKSEEKTRWYKNIITQTQRTVSSAETPAPGISVNVIIEYLSLQELA